MKGCGWIEISEFCLPVSNAESSWGMVKQISENECRWQYLEVLTSFLYCRQPFVNMNSDETSLEAEGLGVSHPRFRILQTRSREGPSACRDRNVKVAFVLPICPPRVHSSKSCLFAHKGKKGKHLQRRKNCPWKAMFEIWPKASGVFCSPTTGN